MFANSTAIAQKTINVTINQNIEPTGTTTIMKNSKLSKVVGASVVAASLAVMPLSLPASAQTDTAPGAPTTQISPESNAPTIDTTPFQETRNDNNNWGWLGLLGLIGLANLFRKPKQTVAYSDPDPANRSTTTRY